MPKMIISRLSVWVLVLTGIIGCSDDKNVYLRVVPVTHKVEFIPKPGDVIHWVGTDGKLLTPTSATYIQFVDKPPCKQEEYGPDTATGFYTLKTGICHVMKVKDGDFPYICYANGCDPDLPVRSNYKVGGKGSLPPVLTSDSCSGPVAYVSVGGNRSVSNGSCVIWTQTTKSDGSITNVHFDRTTTSPCAGANDQPPYYFSGDAGTTVVPCNLVPPAGNTVVDYDYTITPSSGTATTTTFHFALQN